MTGPTRGSLVLRLRDGRDAAAWADFAEVYAPAVFSLARRRNLQPADAADVTQEVCRKAAKALAQGGFDPARGSFRAWLFGVAANEVRMARRTMARRPAVTIDAAEWDLLPADALDEEDFDLELRRRLFSWACEKVEPRVGPATWKAFRLLSEGTPGPEASAATGLTLAACYLAKSRVLKMLREAVAEWGNEEEGA